MKNFDVSLYLVTDERPASELVPLVREAALGGVTLVQLRRKKDNPWELVALGRELLSVLTPLGVPLIINDYAEVAKEIGAAGVHLGQGDLDVRAAREMLGESAVIGLSVESIAQVPEACGADYLAASPVYPTPTKTDTAAPLLLSGVKRLRERCHVPLVAIGGVTRENTQDLLEAGADGVAVVSAICAAPDPRWAARELRETIRRFSPRLLTIAGSDSGGGAGIQADLKTFQALGGYGASAITAVTAQNTSGVTGIGALSPAMVSDQIEAVLSDIGADAIKLGMLFSAEIMEAVAETLSRFSTIPVVVDPVMVAKGGSRLLQESAVEALRHFILPRAAIITPNLPEAEVLCGRSIASESEMESAADRLLDLCPAVLLKGGHLSTREAPDLFATRAQKSWLRYPRIATRNTHGTGCTYSAAVAAFLGRGLPAHEAVHRARDYVQGAILGGVKRPIGNGHGPLNHGWNLRRIT